MALCNGQPGFTIPRGLKCLVTGGSGFVGQRLVEMLVERGADRVISFDIAPKPADAMESTKIEWVKGDLSDPNVVIPLCKGLDCVFHIAALVGPYHPKVIFITCECFAVHLLSIALYGKLRMPTNVLTTKAP